MKQLLCLAIGLAIGCSGTQQATTMTTQPKKETKTYQYEVKTLDEGKAELKKWLDCWQFGDDFRATVAKYKTTVLNFSDHDWSVRNYKLRKYEILAMRQDGTEMEAKVLLTFETTSGGEKNVSVVYMMSYIDGWQIIRTVK